MAQANPDTMKLSQEVAAKFLNNYSADAEILAKVASLVNDHSKFILTTHIGADADGLGSQLALAELLRSKNKQVRIINNEKPPAYLDFLELEQVEDINTLSEEDKTELFNDAFVFILDSSEVKRSDKVGEAFSNAGCDWATIDHHVLEPLPNYCIDSDYAATCEIIWDLYQYYKVELSEKSAAALYAGIVADTGNFRYPKTSMRTHLAGGHLLSYDINSDTIYRRLYESFPADRLVLIKRIFSELHLDKELGYAVGGIRLQMLDGLKLGDAKSEGIVNQLLAVNDIKISALMSETDDGFVKCSLRSLPDYDVASIASQFGGGGHKNASGLKTTGPYDDAKTNIINAIHTYLEGR